MKVVYVAGRFRGKTQWEILQNVHAAEVAGLEVAKLGAMPLMPTCNTRNFHGLLEDQFWIDGTLELLKRCDAIYVFDPNHLETSVGTKAEWEHAAKIGIARFQKLTDLAAWLQIPGADESRAFRLGDIVVCPTQNLIGWIEATRDVWNGFGTTAKLTLRVWNDNRTVEVPAYDVMRPPVAAVPCNKPNSLFGCVLGSDHPGGCAPNNFYDV